MILYVHLGVLSSYAFCQFFHKFLRKRKNTEFKDIITVIKAGFYTILYVRGIYDVCIMYRMPPKPAAVANIIVKQNLMVSMLSSFINNLYLIVVFVRKRESSVQFACTESYVYMMFFLKAGTVLNKLNSLHPYPNT